MLTDEVELAEHGEGMADSHSASGAGGVRILKEVQWDVTEERSDRVSDPDGVREENVRHVAPGV